MQVMPKWPKIHNPKEYFEEQALELELGDAGDLLGDGVAEAGEEAGGDGLSPERVALELKYVALPSSLHNLAHRASSTDS